MSIETRPNLRGLDEQQRMIALAHWYAWLVLQELRADLKPVVTHLITMMLGAVEPLLQPETLHRLAMARDSYWREML